LIFKITSHQGKVIKDCLFDDEDVMLLFNFRWHLAKRNARTYYAAARINTTKCIYMHQLILKVDPGMVVDHINGNGLDNRRRNLRQATIALNLRNQPPQGGRKFKGTYYARRGNTPLRKPWAARLNKASGNLHLGYFETEIEAAKAYNQAALEHFGEYAWLNPINESESA
jgi:hypothetical protein